MIDVPVRVRDALREGSYRKNWRFVILNDDGSEDFTIDNDNLISESVTYDERMCSATKLKFGLCEGTYLDFQYFGFPNITGRHLQAFIDVEYEDADKELKWYSISMGFFDVDECSRQASTGIIKVSCYNKLLSDYLDSDLTSKVKEIIDTGEFDSKGSSSIQNILDILLDGYSIDQKPDEVADWSLSHASTGYGEGIITIFKSLSDTSSPTYVHAQACDDSMKYSLSQNDYYRYIMKSGLREYVEDLFAPVMATYGDWYTVYQDSDGNPLTLREFYNCTSFSPFFSIEAIKGAFGGVAIYKFNGNVGEIAKYYSITEIDGETITPYYLGKTSADIGIPAYVWVDKVGNVETKYSQSQVRSKIQALLNTKVFCVAHRNLSEMEKIRLTSSSISSLTNGLTLRELQSAVFEQQAQFGKLDRETDLFSGTTLNGSRLYPAETLYPADTLYPLSTSESAFKAMYQRLWGDEGNIHKFRYLIITYKGTDGSDHTLQRTIDEHGTDNYNMSNNWLFRNLSWSAEDVGKYADEFVNLVKNVTWFPFEMWCAGLPYVEAGDEIEIPLGENTYTTYVLERTLKGIQNLQDEYMNGSLNIF